MAVTSIWRVHGSVGKVLDYVENAEKTTAVSTGDGDLSDVIDYAIQQRKTSQTQVRDGEEVVQRFVSGINCNPRTAKMEMQKIKKFYGKEDGVIAYHGYQSFAPGEATPELAHEIGVKLAQRLWGDRYQVLVATHLDRANHLHSHFVINTVSFVDGIKYHRTKQDYKEMQRASDALCKEYGLSVIRNPKGRGKTYSEWAAEKDGKPTLRGIIRSDIDRAVLASTTQTYLDVQSKFERYSVSNALLVAAQKPDATDLGEANFWRGRGGYIRKGESGILLMEPGNSYTRKDGSKGVGINVKRVFDISQTTLSPVPERVTNPDIRQLLNAMVRYAPCKVDFRDELPDGQSALYSPQEKTVFVRRGQSMEDVFRGVAQELAHAYLDTGNYSRENNIFLAQCVGNILCQRNGIDGKSLAVTQLPQKYTEMEPKQLREELKSIRTAANQISADMFRFLDAKSHGSRQRDDAR